MPEDSGRQRSHANKLTFWHLGEKMLTSYAGPPPSGETMGHWKEIYSDDVMLEDR